MAEKKPVSPEKTHRNFWEYYGLGNYHDSYRQPFMIFITISFIWKSKQMCIFVKGKKLYEIPTNIPAHLWKEILVSFLLAYFEKQSTAAQLDILIIFLHLVFTT